MKKSVLIFLTLITGCSNPKNSIDQPVHDTTVLEHMADEEYESQQVSLTDTIVNGHAVTFSELTQETFDSLRQRKIETKIPLTTPDNRLTKQDSCFMLQLDNGKIDSLCNWDDGEEFEKYVVKGLWKDKNILLVNFANWEENHDFLLNLNDGSYNILTPYYELSPQADLLLTSVDIAAMPIYESELSVSKAESGKFITLYHKELGQLSITDAFWISNTECIMAARTDIGTSKVRDRKWYRMTIE